MFDLDSVSVQEQSTVTTEADAEPEFDANQVSDFYLAFGDTKRVQTEIAEGTEGCQVINVNYFQNDLTDLPRLLGENAGAHPQAKGLLVTGLAKATFGSWQADHNDHGIGLNTDPDVPEPYESEPAEEKFYYADVHRGLPTIETEGLDGGEITEFEDHGIDTSGLGFSPDEGPQLPVIDGERVPITFDSDEAVQAWVDHLSTLSDDPTDYGVGVTEDSDDGGDEEDYDIEAVRADVDPIFDPTEYTVNQLRQEVNDIDSPSNLKLALEMEEKTKDRKTAKERLQERLNAVTKDGDDGDDAKSRYAEANTEGGDDGTDTSDTDGVSAMTPGEFIQKLMDDGCSATEAADKAEALFGE